MATKKTTKTAPKAKAPKASEASKASKTTKTAAASKGAKAKAAKGARKAALATTNGRATKQNAVLAMLAGGATIADLMKETGWLPHTTRAFLSAVVGKKLGLKLERTKNADGQSVYQTLA